MGKKLTEIVCVVDRSGSMSAMKEEAIGSFNAFLKDQKKLPGKATMTVTLFDHEYQIVHSGIPIKKVPEFTESTYVPRGSTALLDAIGRTIDEVTARIKKTPKKDRPGKLVFIVLTDGYENASKEYNHKQVLDLIDKRTKDDKWMFEFLGAGPNTFSVQSGFLPRSGNVSNYAATPDAHALNVKGLSHRTSSYRNS